VNRAGPPLEALTHRLAEVSADFLAEPRIGKRGSVHVGAVVGDLVGQLGGAATPVDLAAFGAADPGERNRLAVTLLLCWLYADDWFREARPTGAELLSALTEAATDLAAHTSAKSFVADPDRREELVRTALARLDCRPAGETPAQAQDRLASLSATERARVVKAAREAELRAREIRKALARKAAEESADKWTRE
jgi:hypothetical protein